MRGKEAGWQNLRYFKGITPAYAGKRHWQRTNGGCRKDHPRVCGEKMNGPEARGVALGSPPRMRGKVIKGALSLLSNRITPAYAGKRRCCSRCRQEAWDHPRVCGEKKWTLPSGGGGGGSPPRMRGKELDTHGRLPGRGITPAYAGKSAKIPSFAGVW